MTGGRRRPAAGLHVLAAPAGADGMSRFLFVVPPLTGHINPTVAVGAELAARDHDVAWAGHPAMLGPLLPPAPGFSR